MEYLTLRESEEYIGVELARRYLKRGLAMFWKVVHANKIPYKTEIDGRKIFRKSDLDNYMNSGYKN
jgi:hypothetical protein